MFIVLFLEVKRSSFSDQVRIRLASSSPVRLKQRRLGGSVPVLLACYFFDDVYPKNFHRNLLKFNDFNRYSTKTGEIFPEFFASCRIWPIFTVFHGIGPFPDREKADPSLDFGSNFFRRNHFWPFLHPMTFASSFFRVRKLPKPTIRHFWLFVRLVTAVNHFAQKAS